MTRRREPSPSTVPEAVLATLARYRRVRGRNVLALSVCGFALLAPHVVFSASSRPADKAWTVSCKAPTSPTDAQVLDIRQDGLAGTLIVPRGAGPFPGVVIIAGSGPTDRDGNSGLSVKTGAYKMLAEALAGCGIASLRTDKRGLGGSAAAAANGTSLNFPTYVDDVVHWAEWLGRRPDIKSVQLVGHSEGALFAILAAKRSPVTGVVLLAAPGRHLADIMHDQIIDAMPEVLRNEADHILAELAAGRLVGRMSPPLYALFEPDAQRYLMALLRVDPAVEIADLAKPFLIVSGGRDLQVGAKDFNALAHARPDAESLVLPAMNHALKDVADGREANLASYSDPSLPLAHGLAEGVARFILLHQNR